jgi:uridine kinase
MDTKKSQCFIVGISGGSGSGKTSFIRDIRAQFADNQICFLSQDDYYRPREVQKLDENGVINFDLPESLHLDEFQRDLTLLSQRQTVTRREYTFNNEKAHASDLVFKPAPIIIVEGLFVFYMPEVFDMLDLSIMINATDVHKIIRRIKRDQTERNYPLEDVLYRYEHHVLPSFEQYIHPFLSKVDIVINNLNNYDQGRDMLISYLKSKL